MDDNLRTQMKEAMLVCVDFIKRACEELDPKSPEAIIAIVKSLEVFTQIELNAIMAQNELLRRRQKD